MPTDSLAMASSSSSSSTILTDLPPDVLTRSLLLLDGPSLASASSASSLLRSLSSQSDLWLHLSLSTWPSLRHPLTLPFLSRSFFSDAFPFPTFPASSASPPPNQLISAVDIHHRGALIFSRLIETDASSPWFRGSPFFIHAADHKPEPPPPPPPCCTPITSPEEDLRLSWILIDPATGRALNVSSRRAVAVERNCYTGETMVRFAAAAPAGERVIGAVVTCEVQGGEGMGRLREVVLTAEDVDGACVSGEEAMRVVAEMMEGGRKGRGSWEEEEEIKDSYSDFLRRKRRRKESRARREGVLDMCCTAVGVAVFLAFLSLFVFR